MKHSVFLIALFALSCNSGTKNITSNKNNNNMEKFNIEEFRAKKVQINQMYSEVKNDSIIETAEFDDSFVKYAKSLNNPLQNRKVYNKETYSIMAEANYFFKFPVGISKKYNDKGEVIETKNWEENYKFSVDNLMNKMESEFKIDLATIKDVGVDRRFESEKYIYFVMIPTHDLVGSMREIKIDGNTGNTISDEIIRLIKM